VGVRMATVATPREQYCLVGGSKRWNGQAATAQSGGRAWQRWRAEAAAATATAASYTGHGACGARRDSAARTGTRCESHARAWAAPSCSRGMGPGVRVGCGWGVGGCSGTAVGGRRARSSKVAATVCWRSDPRLCK
jgi:hypothetical protein